MSNLCTQTDSYKLGHWNQYPVGTEKVYSYLECREGATYPRTVFFGLQSILKRDFLGQVVTEEKLRWARELARAHFGGEAFFNDAGWRYILERHGGRLPLSIRAVPEGTPVETRNVLMTVENTDPACHWLTNYVESRLTHVWHPSTVATLSRAVKIDLKQWLTETSEDDQGLPFMLHDFGYRGAAGDEAARLGGLGHLVHFLGSDTLPAIEEGVAAYGASLERLAFSVPASEHSVMTSLGAQGEERVFARLLELYPRGVLSVVADSYDIYRFVERIVPKYKEHILRRHPNTLGACRLVIRPDSPTPRHPEPGPQVVWIMRTLAKTFGATVNRKGFSVLCPKVGVLWGDAIDHAGVNAICRCVRDAGFSVESLVFGMGGGLLQRIHRDTQRFAFKCSAQYRDGRWHAIFKEPRDPSKISKRGRMKLVARSDSDHGPRLETSPRFETILLDAVPEDARPDQMVEVFRDGQLLVEWSMDDVRRRAAL